MTRRRVACFIAILLLSIVVLTGAPRQAAPPPPQQTSSAERQLEAAIHREQVLGDVKGAIEQYKQLAQSTTRAVAALALIHLGQCYEKLGEAQAKEARATYERVVRDYADQPDVVSQARLRLAAIAGSRGEATGQRSVKLLLSGGAVGKISPDETQVLSRATSAGSLIIKDLKTGNVRTLLHYGETNGDYVQGSIWSPDGKRIVYTYLSPSPLVVELRMASTDTGQGTVLYSDPKTILFAQSWSPDGKRVVCRAVDTTGTIVGYVLLDVDTGAFSKFVTAHVGTTGSADFSPDGRFVVYDLVEKGNRDLFIYTIATSEITRLTDTPGEDTTAVFSREGAHVLFSSNRRGSWDLWAMPVQNGRPSGDPFLVQADFGNKGKTITRLGRLVYGTSVEMIDVYTLDVDPLTGDSPGVPTLITSSNYGKHESPSWSPDGRQIAYVRNANLLCVRTLQDGREACVESGMAWISWLSWAPDGRSIALADVGLPTKGGIYVYSRESGKVAPLFEVEKGQLTFFTPIGWSANGKDVVWIRYAVQDAQTPPASQDTTHELVAIDVDTKEQRVLDGRFNSGWNYGAGMQFSPDRSRVAYVKFDSEGKETSVVVDDLEDRQRRAVVTLPEDRFYILSPVWSPDGRMLAFHVVDRTTRPASTSVRVAAVDGSWMKTIGTGKLAVVAGRHQDSWSSDGRKLAVTLSTGPTPELWAMENFLPAAKEKEKKQ